ncbi:MAG: tRNA epoxyqueuosine(34) reductase QueG [Alphaproteobacteria bacterium]|nr:tRNA epoxyqueuosine(34) reductase QueG [Alphaproteobacteria bacterium]
MADPIREAIRDQALASGFDIVGFAEAELGAAARAGLAEFIARGYHGDMGWLAGTTVRRGDPRSLWPEARTVVVLGVNYAPEDDPLALALKPDHGAVSVYARGRDYHDTLKRRLKALAHWIEERWPGALKLFVDTAPVMEKPLAERAGLGWQGKHTNLVSRQFGSWLFLGEIYLSLALEPDAAESDHCGSCSRCLDVCPTAAFPAPHRLDARRCISYLTIEHKGMIPVELRPLIGNRIYGCDDCLAVCPWNKFAHAAKEPDFLPRAELTAPRLTELAALDDAAFRKLFAGSAVKRTGRHRFLRNVLIAIGNAPAGELELIAAARRCLDDASPLVRAAAVWAIMRLAPAQCAAERECRLPGEADPLVRAEWERVPLLHAADGFGDQPIDDRGERLGAIRAGG